MTALTVALPPVPSLIVGPVTHTRHRPVRHAFRYTAYQWLVDLAELPRLRGPLAWVSGFSADDHLDRGRLGGGIRGDLVRFLAGRGVSVAQDDRVIMLANARVLGYVFDPLTVFWVLRRSESSTTQVRAVVLEVHNTYGERHAYVLDLDARGRSSVDKDFYVSPFNDATGRYAVSLVLEPGRVRVTVGLDREGERVVTAVTEGEPRAATPRTVARTALRYAFMPQMVSLLIRLHGIQLWRRLPLLPRPPHSEEQLR